MKIKIIAAFILLFPILRTYSQSIELSLEGVNVNNDTIVVMGDVQADTLYTYIFQNDTTLYYSYEVLAEIDVKNISSNSILVQSKKRHIEILPGTENTFCWVSCFPPYTFESINPVPIQSNELTTIFSGHYKPKGKLGNSLVAYTFYNEENTSDSATVFVRYIMQDPISKTKNPTYEIFEFFSSPYPNPSTGWIKFRNKSSNFKNGSFDLFNELGVLIKTCSFTSSETILEFNLNGIKTGNYFYRISTDFEEQKTGLIRIIN